MSKSLTPGVSHTKGTLLNWSFTVLIVLLDLGDYKNLKTKEKVILVKNTAEFNESFLFYSLFFWGLCSYRI